MIILGPKTAILGPQFCRILVLGPQFWWSGRGLGPWAPPGSTPALGLIMYYPLQFKVVLELFGLRTSPTRLMLKDNMVDGITSKILSLKYNNSRALYISPFDRESNFKNISPSGVEPKH